MIHSIPFVPFIPFHSIYTVDVGPLFVFAVAQVQAILSKFNFSEQIMRSWKGLKSLLIRVAEVQLPV